MQLAKVFQSGNSQAIRIPKELRFNTNDVIISKVGEGILLMPKAHSQPDLMALLNTIGPMNISREEQANEQVRDFQ